MDAREAQKVPKSDPYRAALTTSTAAMIRDCGYSSAEPAALESLVEMVQSFITQIGKSSKHYSELANRTQVMVSDVSLAFVDSGISLEGLRTFTEQNLRKSSSISAPDREDAPKKQVPLSVNTSTVQPQYIHENLPSFPDKHTYVQTAAQRHPPTDYQLVRQKASVQRKNTETALTKFIAKTGDSDHYCDDVENPINVAFPLIACKPTALSYLSALLPKDESQFEVFDLKEEQDLPKFETPSQPKRVRIDAAVQEARREINHDLMDEG